MLSYLMVNIAVLACPIIVNIIFNGKFWRNWKPLLFSLLIGGAIYITWDVIATARGDWSFAPNHTLGLKVLGLPLEEIMFFLTVPIACIFIYHSMYADVFQGRIKQATWVWLAIALVLFFATFRYLDKSYTSTVLLVLSGTIVLIYKLMPELLQSVRFISLIIICLLPFIIVNSILTGIPIVQYGADAITGVRFGSIPIEDFIYNFAMISLYIMIYLSWGEHTPARDDSNSKNATD